MVPGVHNPVPSTCMKYSGVTNFIELESRMVVARALGEREWKLFLSGYIPPIWDDEEVLNMDGGESCTTQ